MGRRILPEDLRLNAENIENKRDECGLDGKQVDAITKSLDVAAYMLEIYYKACGYEIED